jgi:undecaprenyl diphosphate synthase
MNRLLEALKPGDPDRPLAEALDPDRLPRHIAIIMDGNGRWARKRNMPRAAGHKAGVEPVRAAIETCARLGIRALTLYAFSTENWKRPRAEVDMLWRLLRVYLRRELGTLVRNDVRLRAIGRLEALPAAARAELLDAVAATAPNRGLIVNLAINYSGRSELVDAVNRILEAGLPVNEETIAQNLFTAGLPDPDLLIRTSGEMRISNFMLWQIAYSELYITSTLWPDFTRADLLRAVLEFQRRERRFGGLADPPPAAADERLIARVSAPPQ